MSFSVNSILVRTGDGHNFDVVTGFKYRANDGEEIEIKPGARTDGASNAKLFWNIIPPFGRYWLPAVLHDFLYRYTRTPRRRCDALLYEAMRSRQVNPVTALIIYIGVRAFGFLAFGKDRR